MIPRLGIVAGAGPLPQALVDLDGDAVLIRLANVPTEARGEPVVQGRIDRLSAVLSDLRRNAVRDIVLAGRLPLAVDVLPQPGQSRTALAARIATPGEDPESAAFLKVLVDTVARSPDAVLRGFIGWLEGHGFRVQSPAEVAPRLLLPTGTTFGRPATSQERIAAITGLSALQALSGQAVSTAVAVEAGRVIGIEAETGLTAMLAALAQRPAPRPGGGVLAVAGWVGQDLRAQMPAIGPDELDQAARAGLAGVFVAARGVAVVAPEAVKARAEAQGLFFCAL